MAHFAHKIHFADRMHFDKAAVARVNSAVMLGSIGGGLAACALGALIFDLGRMVSAW